jgi:hypothetical protein
VKGPSPLPRYTTTCTRRRWCTCKCTFDGMCAAKTEGVNPHQQPDKPLASGQEVRLTRRVGAPSGRCPE